MRLEVKSRELILYLTMIEEFSCQHTGQPKIAYHHHPCDHLSMRSAMLFLYLFGCSLCFSTAFSEVSPFCLAPSIMCSFCSFQYISPNVRMPLLCCVPNLVFPMLFRLAFRDPPGCLRGRLLRYLVDTKLPLPTRDWLAAAVVLLMLPVQIFPN